MDISNINQRIEMFRVLLNSSATQNISYSEILKISQKLDELINLHYALKVPSTQYAPDVQWTGMS